MKRTKNKSKIEEIATRQPNGKIVIDLSSELGNTMVLIGIGANWCEQLGLDHRQFIADMLKGDYANALNVFENYFECIMSFTNKPVFRTKTKINEKNK